MMEHWTDWAQVDVGTTYIATCPCICHHHHNARVKHSPKLGLYYVLCFNCGARTRKHDCMADAIARWNENPGTREGCIDRRGV